MVLRKKNNRNLWVGLLFISPWIIGFVIFILYPILLSLYYSLCDYDLLSAPYYIGFANYADLFWDEQFAVSLYNTFYYTAMYLPLSTILSLSLAMLLNSEVRGLAVFRTLFYLPTIVPVVATSVVWMWLFNPRIGIFNNMLSKAGIIGPNWLGDPKWSKPALVLLGLWAVGQPMVIYLAALQGVPRQLYEAALIDGISSWGSFWHITLPFISPSVLFNVVMSLISSFQYFTEAYVISQGDGGPANSTLFYALNLYRNAFRYLKMGYASSMAWILFVVILVSTMLLFKTSGRYVYYGGE